MSVRPDELTGERLGELLLKTTRTVGTGFVIDADGLILTNEHVVADAEQIWCTTDGGRVLPAYVVGSDPRFDLAVLRVPAVVPLMPVRFAALDAADVEPAGGDADGSARGPRPPVGHVGGKHAEAADGGAAEVVRRGQWVLTLGNPYGMAVEGRLAMSVGVVSAVGRSLPRLSSRENRVYRDLIQTTAEINPGNSGGPLFDLDGRVVGINTAVVLPQRNAHGIGFAMPVTRALLARVELLKRGLEVPSAHLGVTVSEPTPGQRRQAGLEREIGVSVESVERSSGVAGGESALRPGDIVVRVEDREIGSVNAFSAAVAMLRPGVPIRLTVWRGGRETHLIVTPQRRAMPSSPVWQQTQRYRWRGMVLGPIPEGWTFAAGRPPYGLMVLASDPSVSGALPAGTVVQSVGGRALHTVADLQAVLATVPPEKWRLTVVSPGSAAAVAGELP